MNEPTADTMRAFQEAERELEIEQLKSRVASLEGQVMALHTIIDRLVDKVAESGSRY